MVSSKKALLSEAEGKGKTGDFTASSNMMLANGRGKETKEDVDGEAKEKKRE